MQSNVLRRCDLLKNSYLCTRINTVVYMTSDVE